MLFHDTLVESAKKNFLLQKKTIYIYYKYKTLYGDKIEISERDNQKEKKGDKNMKQSSTSDKFTWLKFYESKL